MRLILASVVLPFVVSTPLAAQDIALDAAHGHELQVDPATSAVFAEFRMELEALGFTLHSRSTFGAAQLAGMEAVFLMQPFVQRYTEGEIAAIASFAQAGGGVVILACGGGSSDSINFNMNALVAPYGCSFQDFASNSNGTVIGPLAASHAITHGVASFGLDFHRVFASIGAPSADLTVLGGVQNALAVAESFGGGHDVVMVSSATAFFGSDQFTDHDLGTPGNRHLLRNVAVNAASGHDDFVLMPLTPGIAGQSNTVRVFEAVPGRRVFFLAGGRIGSVERPGAPPAIRSPILFGSAMADGSGTASLNVHVPASFASRTLHVQALQIAPLGRSNYLTANF